MLHTTQWGPDTCDCVIEFEWDDTVPAEQRVHTGKKVVKRCSAHGETDFSDYHDQYSTVLGENQRKNIVLGKMVEAYPELADSTGKTLRPDIDYIHNFTGNGKNRVLEVEFAGQNFTFQQKHKDKIKEIADSEFGVGKVVVK